MHRKALRRISARSWFALALPAAMIPFLMVLGPSPVAAQAPPQRTITIVAATAAGGPGDTAARVIAERMGPLLGQQIIVENVPGAGGNMAATRVARAAPDGSTLLVHQTGITVAPAVASNLAYDVEKDLVAVGMVNSSNSLIVGRKTLPAGDWAQLVAWMRGPGKPAKVAHSGVGSLGHINALLLGKTVDAEVSPVAYRGVGPIMNDIAGGHVDLVFAGAVNSMHQLRAGVVKAYAFTGPKRSAAVAEIPSVAELGATDLQNQLWHALFAPAATPKPVVARINGALREALRSPELLKAYADGGVEVLAEEYLTPEGAARYVRNELERWQRVAKQIDLSK